MYSYALTEMKIKEEAYAVCFGLDSNRKMDSFHICPMSDKIRINNIYAGRVEKILPNINAAFVRIAPEQTVYLPLAEAKDPIYTYKQSKNMGLCVGDEVLVQIIKDAIKTKEPQASCNLTLQSAYFLLTTNQKSYSVSKKIADEKAEQIKELYSELLCDYSSDKKFGLVARTIAENRPIDELRADLLNLLDKYNKILAECSHKKLYSLVYRESLSLVTYLKNKRLSSEECIVTDRDHLFQLIEDEIPAYKDNLRKYTDDKVSLSVLYHLRGNLDQLLNRQLWLKSGGNIIIEQLETLTVIDVNSAKSNGKNDIAFSVNLEALKEILLQIRLRNISGMILIDFINMNEEETEKFLSILKKDLKDDPIPTVFQDITKLGIVELTRKKTEKSIKEILA